MIERPRLRSAVGWLAGSALTARMFGAVTGVVTARTLGPEGRGTLALLLLAGLVGGSVASSGIDVWAARMLARGAENREVVQLLRRHQASTLVVAAVVAAVVVGTTEATAVGTAATALLAWTTSGAVLKLGLLQGSDRMRAYGLSMLTGVLFYTVGVVGLALAGRGSVVAFLVAAVAGKAVTAAWRTRDVRRKGRTSVAVVVAYRDAVSFGATTMLGGLATLALYRLDVALVAWWRSTAEAGVYSVALAVAEVLWVLPNSAAQALLPRASEALPTVDTAKVCRVLVAGMGAVALVVSVASPFAIPLVFGSGFGDAAHALPGLAAGSVAVGVWKILAHDLMARGDARTRFRSGLAGVLAMVAFDAAFVPRFGVVGASVGSLVAYGTAAAVTVHTWRSRTEVSLSELLLVRRGDLVSLWRTRRSRDVVEPITDPPWGT